MLNQGTYNQGNEYKSFQKVGVCIGLLCGAPVYRRFEAKDIRQATTTSFITKEDNLFKCFDRLAKVVKAGPQPHNQMGSIKL